MVAGWFLDCLVVAIGGVNGLRLSFVGVDGLRFIGVDNLGLDGYDGLRLDGYDGLRLSGFRGVGMDGLWSVVVVVVVLVVVVVVIVVVVSELLYEDFAQQPGKLLSLGLSGVRGVPA